MAVRSARRRGGDLLVGGVIVALILMAVLWAAGLKRGFATTPCDPVRAPKAGAVASAAGVVVVAEQGFSWVEPWVISIGAVVVNQSKQAAYRTIITFKLVGPDGEEVLAVEPPEEVPVILPGRRVPIGAAWVLPAEQARDVARVAVSVGGTRWVRVDDGNRLFRPVERAVVVRESPSAGATAMQAGVPPDLSYYCAGLDERGIGLVYRDAGGAIVGGGGGAYYGSHCGGSHHGASLRLAFVPPRADLARTQLSIYCDIAEPSPDTS
jgi:hypothetical protein